MQIRTITLGADLSWPLEGRTLPEAGAFLREARSRYQQAGTGVQTLRFCSQPWTRLLPPERAHEAPGLGREAGAASQFEGIEYCSLGPVPAGLGETAAAYYAQLPALLAAHPALFATVEVANQEGGIDFAAVQAAARTILALAPQEAGGFANLRFAALANCPPNIPFFPAAWHAGGPPRFAIALEMADLAVNAFAGVAPQQAEQQLTASVERAVAEIEAVALPLERHFGVAYEGVDLSPAPFPKSSCSIGQAVENLGIDGFGAPGTLYAAALVTRALRAVRGRKCGFSGLMMPVLEDNILARRAAVGGFGVTQALAYSAVCGTGLDTVPLPGEVSEGQLMGVLLDVAALAATLRKPLTARLMPVPGRKAGEPTEFDFPFFANSRVMPLPGGASGAAPLLARAVVNP